MSADRTPDGEQSRPAPEELAPTILQSDGEYSVTRLLNSIEGAGYEEDESLDANRNLSCLIVTGRGVMCITLSPGGTYRMQRWCTVEDLEKPETLLNIRARCFMMAAPWYGERMMGILTAANAPALRRRVFTQRQEDQRDALRNLFTDPEKPRD